MPHFFSVIFQIAINACVVAEIVLSKQAVALSVKKNYNSKSSSNC